MSREWLSRFAYLEWEGLQEPWSIEHVSEAGGGIPIGSARIKLRRDDHYQVEGELTGTYVDESELAFDVQPGTLARPLAIDGQGNGYRYALRRGYLRAYTSLLSLKEGVDHTFTSRLDYFEVTRTYDHRELPPVPRWLTQWYLNGPRSSDVFWRGTEREMVPHYTRARDTTLFKAPERPAQSFSADHAFIEYGGKSFIIHQVPREFGPSWSANLGIEYRPEWGGIPAREKRIAIAEIVGFVLGRRLLNAGFTEYDELGDPITEMVTSPPGDNIVAMCQASGPRPINVEPHSVGGRSIEDVLPSLVPAYLALRESLRLNDAVWRYDMSRDLPVGIDLPVVAAAIEGVAALWLEANEARRIYLEPDRYNELLTEDLVRIEAKLQAEGIPDDDRQKMMNKLRGAYSMSGNESLYLFFKRIGLKVGKFERDAIKARNPMAHGGPTMPKDLAKASTLRTAYQTLFVRMLLKLLKYDGFYIDYSSVGCPARHIDEPQGGI